MTPQVANAALQFLQRAHIMPNERNVFDIVERALIELINGQSTLVSPAPEPETPVALIIPLA